ncbi:MAG: hypothetical protein AABY33_07085 [Pseudomonadota bacterium]
MLYFKSPLSWPESIPVTAKMQQRSDNGFSADMSLTDAINFLKEEIEATGINHAVLYLDVEQPQVERLRKKIGSRTGACLHLKYRDKGYIITCDRWQKMEHNIYAMHLAVRQWLNMQRWGIGWLSMLMAGFEIEAGYDINDAPTEGLDIAECLKSFGLGSTATLDDATAIYHRRAKTLAHDNEKLVKLNLQMDEIRIYFQNKEPG